MSYICQFALWFYVGMLFEKHRAFFEEKFFSIKIQLFMTNIELYAIYEILGHNLASFAVKDTFKGKCFKR